MRTARITTLVLAPLIACSLVVTACGGGDKTASSGDQEQSGGGAASLDDVKQATVQILSSGEIRTFEGSTGFDGSGSGFIFDKSGLIVTNNHVVTGAGSLKVKVAGKDEEIPAKVLGVSECNDLAVIKLTDEGDYPTLSFSTEKVEPPLEVYAAGFPLGDPEYTVTKGIVSKAQADGDTNWASVRNVIEHDAAIQPGNSGGPLVDSKGKVVGINYAGGDPGTGTEQFFAINSSDVKSLVNKLKDGDQDSLGINGEAVIDEEAGVAGVWVNGVAPGGAADKAGVKPGDLITTLNGVALESGTMKEYCDVIRSNDATDTISIRLFRPDTEEFLEGELNGKPLESSGIAGSVSSDLPAGGTDATAPSAETTELKDDQGRLVMSVPTSWSQTTTAPQNFLQNGTLSPAIQAAPNLSAFEASTGPGVGIFLVEGVSGKTADELLTAAVGGVTNCQEKSREDYSDGAFTGRLAALTCGQVATVILIANSDADPSKVIVLIGSASTDADLNAIDNALATFNLT